VVGGFSLQPSTRNPKPRVFAKKSADVVILNGACTLAHAKLKDLQAS